MNAAKLAERIRAELDEIGRVLERARDEWEEARRSNDDRYLDGVALNLHGFYSGVERIFTLIAETLDNSMPQGENWHVRLLEQMTRTVPNVRPAVISKSVCKQLDEYRGFRHIVRNVYAYHLNPLKLEKLVKESAGMFAQLAAELSAFIAFLENGDS
jgi:hypothetical protein